VLLCNNRCSSLLSALPCCDCHFYISFCTPQPPDFSAYQLGHVLLHPHWYSCECLGPPIIDSADLTLWFGTHPHVNIGLFRDRLSSTWTATSQFLLVLFSVDWYSLVLFFTSLLLSVYSTFLHSSPHLHPPLLLVVAPTSPLKTIS